MNRIQYLVEDEARILPAHAVHVPPLAVALTSDRENPYCLFTPQHYERNYAYPLVIWLHGPDDDERQVTRVMPLVSLRNYVAVGPRGTRRTSTPGGYCWSQDADDIALAEEGVLSALAAARRWLNIARSRVYLGGYACGGTMALRIALNHPRRFAGALSIGGAFPTTLRSLARFHELRGLKVFLAVGRESRDYPEQEVCRHLRLMHAAGISLNLRLYPGGDEVTTDMLADVDRWIMEQVASEQPAACDEPTHRSR